MFLDDFFDFIKKIYYLCNVQLKNTSGWNLDDYSIRKDKK